jgi:hypothetical protein
MKLRGRFALLKLRWLLSLIVIGTLAVGIVASTSALSGTPFESTDGNLLVDGALTTDWESFVATVSKGGVSAGDPNEEQSNDDNSYKGGAKHDTVCPQDSTGGIPPNKDDLTNLYVVDETISGDVFVYLGWSRFLNKDSSASAHMSFEFNQSETPCGGNSANVLRTQDDILILYDLEGGGTPVLKMRTWNGNSTSGSWGNEVDLTAAGFADGGINLTERDIEDPISGGTYPFLNQFGEAAINLSAAGVFGDECKGFGRATLGSRSSGNSFESTMKDFIGPIPIDINNCGRIDVLKVDDVGTVLAGAQFELFNDDGDTPGEHDAADTSTGETCTTDANGECSFPDLFFGDYCVVEIVGVPGHQSADPQCVSVTTTTTVELTFVNPRDLYKVIVFVCDQSDNTLHASSVTLDQDLGGQETKTSLGLAPQELEDAVCALTATDGATFVDRPSGDYDGSVDIP